MKPKRAYSDYLRDILDAIEKVQAFTHSLSFDQFVNDDKTVWAVIRGLEIIGEATKQLPSSLRRSYPQVPWREVAGMRDVLSHGYFGVNLKRVWQTVQDDLSPLREAVLQILADLAGEEQAG